MYNFQFFMPTKVLFGAGQLQNLHKEVLPGKKALVVISGGTSAKRYGYLAALENELDLAGVEHVLFDEIRPNPTTQSVMDGTARAKEAGCDFVVALGGGSVMDSSKMIAMMMTNPGTLWDYSGSKAGGKKPFAHDAAPLVCVTTSAGTASEVDFGGVISNDEAGEKSALFHPSMFPVLSVVDSDLTLNIPPHLTAYQGMDAFFHAAETVINRNVHPMAEMFALKTIELVAKYLPKACKDGSDREARAAMHLANSLAGFYMLCTSQHTMEHVMGSNHPGLEHGAGLIMISHAYFDFFAERRAAESQMAKMAQAMGVMSPTSGKAFIRALDNLIMSVGCSGLKMSNYGITEEEVLTWPQRIHEVIGGDLTADPLPLSDDDYLTIYQQSYK